MLKWGALAVIAVYLGGCSWLGTQSLYEVRLDTGERLYTESKPNLRDDGFYVFDDVNNQQYIIDKTTVLYIDPVKFSR